MKRSRDIATFTGIGLGLTLAAPGLVSCSAFESSPERTVPATATPSANATSSGPNTFTATPNVQPGGNSSSTSVPGIVRLISPKNGDVINSGANGVTLSIQNTDLADEAYVAEDDGNGLTLVSEDGTLASAQTVEPGMTGIIVDSPVGNEGYNEKMVITAFLGTTACMDEVTDAINSEAWLPRLPQACGIRDSVTLTIRRP